MNCGTPSHDDACLCDVKIETITPIRYGITEVWHAHIIASAMDVSAPWSSTDLASFADTLMRAYDMCQESTRGIELDMNVLRRTVKQHLSTGGSMLDVEAATGASVYNAVRALTNGTESHCWNWDEHDWLIVEAIIQDEWANMGRPALIERLSVETGGPVTNWMIRMLSDWYQVTPNTNQAARVNLCRQLLVDGHGPTATQELLADVGYTMSITAITALRSRMRKQGALEPAAEVC